MALKEYSTLSRVPENGNLTIRCSFNVISRTSLFFFAGGGGGSYTSAGDTVCVFEVPLMGYTVNDSECDYQLVVFMICFRFFFESMLKIFIEIECIYMYACLKKKTLKKGEKKKKTSPFHSNFLKDLIRMRS